MGKALTALALACVGLVCWPAAAHAWTPGTHIFLGESVLANLAQLPVDVVSLLRAFPYDFLYGNIAEDGCIVKTAGVDASLLTFSGPARIFESQDAAVEAILGDRVKAGDVVVIRYEGPKGGPGMQEMLYPTSYLKSKGLGKACALITDGRFPRGTSGLSLCHVSPEPAQGGAIGLVEEGDTLRIDIPPRTIRVDLADAELARRRGAMEQLGERAWTPRSRDRHVSPALQAYAAMTTSADRGAVRDVTQLAARPPRPPKASAAE